MSAVSGTPNRVIQICMNFAPVAIRRVAPLGGALVCLALVIRQENWRFTLLSAGIALLVVVLTLWAIPLRHLWGRKLLIVHLGAFLDRDAAPCIATDADGLVIYTNPAARQRFGDCVGESFARQLTHMFASPEQTLAEISSRARRQGRAHANRATRHGWTRLTAVGGGAGAMVWRLDTSAASAAISDDNLDLAIRMMVVAGDGSILATNSALRALVDGIPGRTADLIDDLPCVSGHVHHLHTRGGLIPRRVFRAEGADGGEELYFLPAAFGEEEPTGLFDTLPVPLLRLSPSGEILMANHAARDLLGRPISEGSLLSEVLSGLGRSIGDWLADAAAGRGLNQSEFLQVLGAESDRFVQITLKRMTRDREVSLIAVLNDATELKTLEAQFVQSQKMQAIGQLAGGVAHDFNNLLTAISGHCDLLLLRHDARDPEYSDLVQIHQNTNRAASLVGQLLAFSRKQTLQPQILDLRDTLADLTHLLNRLVGEKVELRLSHDPGLPSIRADKRQLEQVIMNLVVNARDAMPAGGEILIETQAVTLECDFRRNRASIPPGSYAVVRVIDQGVGIVSDKLSKVFEPFYTTKKTGEGTGLGLSTAYGIIKQTGGFIFADSTPEVGTVFTIYLPAHLEAVATVVAPPPPPPVAQGPAEGVVLLVEDEAPVRAFASRALMLRGYTVLEAENAHSALDLIADPDLRIDVFVTDVVMPGLDGPTWVREALKQRPDTRVVFVSGYAEDALSAERDRIPNSVFLPKPFSLQELIATVQEQLS